MMRLRSARIVLPYLYKYTCHWGATPGLVPNSTAVRRLGNLLIEGHQKPLLPLLVRFASGDLFFDYYCCTKTRSFCLLASPRGLYLWRDTGACRGLLLFPPQAYSLQTNEQTPATDTAFSGPGSGACLWPGTTAAYTGTAPAA